MKPKYWIIVSIIFLIIAYAHVVTSDTKDVFFYWNLLVTIPVWFALLAWSVHDYLEER